MKTNYKRYVYRCRVGARLKKPLILEGMYGLCTKSRINLKNNLCYFDQKYNYSVTFPYNLSRIFYGGLPNDSNRFSGKKLNTYISEWSTDVITLLRLIKCLILNISNRLKASVACKYAF